MKMNGSQRVANIKSKHVNTYVNIVVSSRKLPLFFCSFWLAHHRSHIFPFPLQIRVVFALSLFRASNIPIFSRVYHDFSALESYQVHLASDLFSSYVLHLGRHERDS